MDYILPIIWTASSFGIEYANRKACWFFVFFLRQFKTTVLLALNANEYVVKFELELSKLSRNYSMNLKPVWKVWGLKTKSKLSCQDSFKIVFQMYDTGINNQK